MGARGQATWDEKGNIQRMAGFLRDIHDRKQEETLLQTIHNAESKFISTENPAQIFEELLHTILNLTESEFGFIGEVLQASDGARYLKAHAISNIAWNEETQELYTRLAPTLEFFNLETLFGAVITTGKPVIANDPKNDPRGGGLPKGHPPLHAFLGLPIHLGGRLIGMVGIANRAQGYVQSLVDCLQPLLTTC